MMSDHRRGGGKMGEERGGGGEATTSDGLGGGHFSRYIHREYPRLEGICNVGQA